MKRRLPAVAVVRRVAVDFSDARVRALVEAALHAAGFRKPAEVGVVFVGDAEMKKLNAGWRGKRGTTDVLSFGQEPSMPKDPSSPNLLGDVIVSVPQARRQAAKAKRALRDEIAMLLVHGCLHLLGHDHERRGDAKVMFSLQNRALNQLGYV